MDIKFKNNKRLCGAIISILKRKYGGYLSAGDFDKEYLDSDFKVVKNKSHFLDNWDFVGFKYWMIRYVKQYFAKNGYNFDEFNGLPPTRVNEFKAYEFGTLGLWTILIKWIEKDAHAIALVSEKEFYTTFKDMISKVFKKYPNITGTLITEIDLHYPDNKLMDCINMENAEFDSENGQNGWNDAKADEFRGWLLGWCSRADEKDKMRVNNWFKTKKSHKQIFSEIQRVIGNTHKFNSRLAVFVETLLTGTDVDYFYEKTGFDSKEDLIMAYFEKIPNFDDETKRSFIRKYLVK